MALVTPTSIRIIDLDSGASRHVSWDPSVPDEVFESVFEGTLRTTFGITDDSWVDLIDLNTSSLVPMSKHSFFQLTTKTPEAPLVLTLSPKTESLAPLKKDDIVEVTFPDRSLGITIRDYHRDNVVVNAFRPNSDGTMGYTQSTGLISIGDVVYKVGGVRAIGRQYDSVIQMLQTPIRPLSVHFFRPRMREGLYAVEFTGSALNLTITSDDDRVLVSRLPPSLPNVMGFAEARGVRVGDSIHAIDGHILNGPEYARAVSLLKRSTRPLVVVFWRASVQPQYMMQALENTTPKSSGHRHSVASWSAPSPTPSPRPSLQKIGRAPSTLKELQSPGSHYDAYNNNNMTATGQGGSLFGDSMTVADMMDYCDTVASVGVVTLPEASILKDMLAAGRGDLASAIRHRNKNAIVALVRSPTMHLWDQLLKTRERVVLAGPVASKKTKRYHLILTDHERLLFVNKTTNALEDEVLCSHIVTVSSRSKMQEVILSTAKTEYVLLDSFIGPSVWVRAILPFTHTQGYLKVHHNPHASLLGPKKRYFLLKNDLLSEYKRDNMTNDKPLHVVSLRSCQVRVVDAKSFKFEITTSSGGVKAAKMNLVAPSAREYNKWMASLQAFVLAQQQQLHIVMPTA
ncbi:hypothetical protein H257_05345 [Aphanomyces astaci]|uniref:PH domain-containing protein n=2 Tax=Aphanomyces astaci TaxID=112090 RepID=W4GS78_APHAT|nr:hypothetical protein H257_05345 [Aphanomyces astaci]ETV81753.1 hypothetical protein H257_05345 [Aphanomyces astaci]RQM30791.1 hypothetical protein B5M09_013135 [Aphanomyces astaci]|eukprot:XP_009828490.1 hypothetical protein H257_05345 [Aphanomyces astaci]